MVVCLVDAPSKEAVERGKRRHTLDGMAMSVGRDRYGAVGVNVCAVPDQQFIWRRIYTELVRAAGEIDGQLERMMNSALQ
jgi:hypothetical protein